MPTLADVIRASQPAYATTHAGSLLPSQRRALHDLVACRTPALGGSLYRCEACGTLEYRYHSCRNRHCPTCQEDRGQQWLDRVRARLLPCDHYLLTFTLPAELRAVARAHQRVVYGALLHEAAATVQTLAADPQWVGGAPTILAVLHTWTRTLDYHPHAHLLVSAGGLAPDGTTWMTPVHARFLVSGYVLSSVFRAKLRASLARAGLLPAIPPAAWERNWIVHVQRIGRGDHAVRYLARYVFRVALTNDRLERLTGTHVTFRYTHAKTGEQRRQLLSIDAFLTRFLLHTLPGGFAKVRWSGLLSPGRRPALERARQILDLHATAIHAPPVTAALPTDDRDASTDSSSIHQPADTLVCRSCRRAALRLVERLRRPRAPP